MTEIKLDIDQHRVDWLQITRRIHRLHLHPTCIKFSYSKSGNVHIVIRISGNRPALAVVAIQSILGSDWKREAFNYLRVLQLRKVPKFWRTRWNRLYEAHIL